MRAGNLALKSEDFPPGRLKQTIVTQVRSLLDASQSSRMTPTGITSYHPAQACSGLRCGCFYARDGMSTRSEGHPSEHEDKENPSIS